MSNRLSRGFDGRRHVIKEQNKGTMRRNSNLLKEVSRYRKHECLSVTLSQTRGTVSET